MQIWTYVTPKEKGSVFVVENKKPKKKKGKIVSSEFEQETKSEDDIS